MIRKQWFSALNSLQEFYVCPYCKKAQALVSSWNDRNIKGSIACDKMAREYYERHRKNCKKRPSNANQDNN